MSTIRPPAPSPSGRLRTAVSFRPPRPPDGRHVSALVRACPPLDVNSTYAYLLVCSHFAGTSVVAERGGDLIGFVSAYRRPDDPEVIFVWQVAVAAAARGQGLASRMLDEILARPGCCGVRHLETTITPSNGPSWRLFRALARGRGARCDRAAGFDREALGGDHEDEQLVRIGPLDEPLGGP